MKYIYLVISLSFVQLYTTFDDYRLALIYGPEFFMSIVLKVEGNPKQNIWL